MLSTGHHNIDNIDIMYSIHHLSIMLESYNNSADMFYLTSNNRTFTRGFRL